MLNSSFPFSKGQKELILQRIFSAFSEGNTPFVLVSFHSARVDERIEKKGPTKVVGVHRQYPRLPFQ